MAQSRPIRVAVLLPGKVPAYARTVEAIKAGIHAAGERSDRAVAIDYLDTPEDPVAIESLLRQIAPQVDLIIGPLNREAVTHLARKAAILAKPVVMLNLSDDDMPKSIGRVMMFALSLETEARQIAKELVAENPEAAKDCMVVHPSSTLYQRVADAFVQAMQAQQIKVTRLESEDPEAVRNSTQFNKCVFLSGDGLYAIKMRPVLPEKALVYTTSLVNSDNPGIKRQQWILNDVRFLDQPWMIDPTSSAVYAFKQFGNTPGEQYVPPSQRPKLPHDLERLFAFGVDSLRLGLRWLNEAQFEMIGVTGELSVDTFQSPVVNRTLSRGVFQAPKIVPKAAVKKAKKKKAVKKKRGKKPVKKPVKKKKPARPAAQ